MAIGRRLIRGTQRPQHGCMWPVGANPRLLYRAPGIARNITRILL
jgi:hypothetical protein